MLVGDGLRFTLIVQLLNAGRLAAQVVAEIKNSGGTAVGTLSVIAAALELVTVTFCGGDCVPCAVEPNVSDVGAAATSGAVAVPISAHEYETGGCTVTGRNGADALETGLMDNVAVSVVGTDWLYVTTTWQLAPAATNPQVFDVTANAGNVVVGAGTLTGTLSSLKNTNACDWLPPATIAKLEYVEM